MIASQRNFGARRQRNQIKSKIQITKQMVRSEMRNKKRKLEIPWGKISHNINNSKLGKPLRVQNTHH